MISIEDFDFILSGGLLYQIRSAQMVWVDHPRVLLGQDAASDARAEPDPTDGQRIDRWLVELADQLFASQCQPNPVNQSAVIATDVRLATVPRDARTRQLSRSKGLVLVPAVAGH